MTRLFSPAAWRRRLAYWQAVRRLKGPRVIRRFCRLYPQAFFIQIGSNDGEQLDHLRQAILNSNWQGVMIEPVPYVFRRLEKNYGGLKRLRLVNVAIADRNGQMPFWHLRQAGDGESLPQWYDALGSFRREVVLKHRDMLPDLEERIVCSEVPARTFSSLCDDMAVDQVDLIQMDTEGYDFEIIRNIDFARFRPRLVIYEHHHFDDETRQACESHMQTLGYDFFAEGMDTWCIDTRAADDRHRKLLDYWMVLKERY